MLQEEQEQQLVSEMNIEAQNGSANGSFNLSANPTLK